jgi:hypothetical protein
MKSLMRFEVRRNKRKGRRSKINSGKNNKAMQWVKKKRLMEDNNKKGICLYEMQR